MVSAGHARCPCLSRYVCRSPGSPGTLRTLAQRARQKRDPSQPARCYPLRSYLFCAMCGRRMFGKNRRGLSYYACAPKPGYISDDHPKSLWIRESHVLEPLNNFFADRLFGPSRRELVAAVLPQADDAAWRRHADREQALRTAMSDLTRRRERQFHALEVAESLDQVFIQGVQARVADLDAQIRIKKDELETHKREAPPRQDSALVDALPVGRCELAALPDATRRRMFEAFRLQLHYDERTHSVRCQVTLTSETIDGAAWAAGAARRAVRPDENAVPICVVPPAGLEPAAKRLEGACSIH